jgi:CRP-like cAMP-binding protein
LKLDARPIAPALPAGTNRPMRQLPEAERVLLGSQCEHLQLRAGQLLGGAVPLTCFPETAVLSLVDARGVEIGLVGREGMSGWSVLLGDAGLPVRVAVACGGVALALPTERLTELCRRSAAIRDMVLRSVESLAQQMVATIGASARHSIRARLTRRLLMLHDRSGGDSFDVKHAQIAEALGVRRASVTDTLHLLEGEHILRCRRNSIGILDRSALEAAAGTAYGEPERILIEIA